MELMDFFCALNINNETKIVILMIDIKNEIDILQKLKENYPKAKSFSKIKKYLKHQYLLVERKKVQH